jgi:beta-glucosidase
MYGKFIRNVVSRSMHGSNDTATAMAGKTINDHDMFPAIDKNSSLEDQVDALLNQMTLQEKISMLGGEENLAIRGIPRLNIPRVWCTDATAGTRCFGRATAFPTPIAMTATWNPELLSQIGSLIGEECRAKGVSILLGPGVNIYRVPTCGRNFEYMGEDPYLAGKMAIAYITGVQSKGVITTVKHFVCNNSDYDRHRMNSEVDERTLHEIYFPAFKAAIIQAKSMGVMCSYNPVNGIYASENDYLLTDILRKKWKFSGFVISDWTCVYSTEGPLKAGLDVEMPKANYLNYKKIKPLLDQNKISEELINSHVRNLLSTFIRAGIYNRQIKNRSCKEYSSEHDELALQAAQEAICLLKNHDGTLPLDLSQKITIVLTGPNANPTETSGGGSCFIKPHENISIFDGLNTLIKENDSPIQITHIPFNHLSKKNKSVLKQADYIIFCAGFTKEEESECFDRPWELSNRQSEKILFCGNTNQNTIVVLTAGGGVETESWLDSVKGFIHSFFLGQATGKAIAQVLFGLVNPSGKLPFTMAKKWDDFASTQYYVPHPEKIAIRRIIGPQGNPHFRKKWTVKYAEKLMVGYRHFDTQKIVPQFAFGSGLSYTNFAISPMKLSKTIINHQEISSDERDEVIKITFEIKNIGFRAGAEVVQLYIHDCESSLVRPDKELKSFKKIFLNPGESHEVTFSIYYKDLCFYDPKIHSWKAEFGYFEVILATSATEIIDRAEISFQ